MDKDTGNVCSKRGSYLQPQGMSAGLTMDFLNLAHGFVKVGLIKEFSYDRACFRQGKLLSKASLYSLI